MNKATINSFKFNCAAFTVQRKLIIACIQNRQQLLIASCKLLCFNGAVNEKLTRVHKTTNKRQHLNLTRFSLLRAMHKFANSYLHSLVANARRKCLLRARCGQNRALSCVFDRSLELEARMRRWLQFLVCIIEESLSKEMRQRLVRFVWRNRLLSDTRKGKNAARKSSRQKVGGARNCNSDAADWPTNKPLLRATELNSRSERFGDN